MKLSHIDRINIIQKGHVKLHRGERILETRKRTEDRYVRIDTKTVTIVKRDDPRTDEEIRRDFLLKQAR